MTCSRRSADADLAPLRAGPHRRPRVGGRVTGRLARTPKEFFSPAVGHLRRPTAGEKGRGRAWYLAYQSSLRRHGVGGGGYEDRRDRGSAKRLICEWPTSMGGDNRFIFTTVVLNFTPFPREQAG